MRNYRTRQTDLHAVASPSLTGSAVVGGGTTQAISNIARFNKSGKGGGGTPGGPATKTGGGTGGSQTGGGGTGGSQTGGGGTGGSQTSGGGTGGGQTGGGTENAGGGDTIPGGCGVALLYGSRITTGGGGTGRFPATTVEGYEAPRLELNPS